MRLFLRALAAFTLVPNISFAAEKPCVDVLKEMGLLQTSAAIELLQNASPEYLVRIFTQTTESGAHRALVVLAEYHRKSYWAKNEGRNILKYFSNRALEQSSASLLRARQFLGVETEQKPPYWMSVYFSLVQAGGSQILGSTMWDAIVMTDPIKTAAGELLPVRVFPIDVKRQNPLDRLSDAMTMIDLDGRYLLGLYGFAMAGAEVAHLAGDANVSAAPMIMPGVVAILFWLANRGYVRLNRSLGTRLDAYSDRRWYQILFAPRFGTIHLRNEGLVQEIERIFLSEPQINELLVIIGRNHLDGVVTLLERKGWQPLDLGAN